ncbi:hypothetical protein BV25DRAFT_496597 [Artomyces pyxidatus]|uniref:Uncharacterized protein n=1 Tax=Artomyces pyxidatus TaxID=48021 RepID=A0ACB8T569_9AGAM|nr:hypothetical protein BV25DRAFT_496597 [Artomyces pyxidatus]
MQLLEKLTLTGGLPMSPSGRVAYPVIELPRLASIALTGYLDEIQGILEPLRARLEANLKLYMAPDGRPDPLFPTLERGGWLSFPYPSIMLTSYESGDVSLDVWRSPDDDALNPRHSRADRADPDIELEFSPNSTMWEWGGMSCLSTIYQAFPTEHLLDLRMYLKAPWTPQVWADYFGNAVTMDSVGLNSHSAPSFCRALLLRSPIHSSGHWLEDSEAEVPLGSFFLPRLRSLMFHAVDLTESYDDAIDIYDWLSRALRTRKGAGTQLQVLRLHECTLDTRAPWLQELSKLVDLVEIL